MWAPPAFTELFQDRFVEQTVQQRYLSDRTSIWQAAWQLFADNPIGGAGLDGFYGLIGVNRAIEYPHNYVLGVAAEGGLVGLILLGTAIVLWARTVRRGGDPRVTVPAVLAAVFVFVSSLFSGDYYDARLAWLFAAMAAAAAVTRTGPARPEQPVPEPERVPR
jgi:O-antigen ligase